MDSDVSFHSLKDATELRALDFPSMPSKTGSSSTISLSDDSDLEPEELVSTINYNAESSMAALKDVSGDTVEKENGSFFHRYFQNHSNSLPSRIAVAARRLSQCREEDEEDDKRELKEPVPSNYNISGSDKSLSDTSSGSKTSVIDTVSGPTHKFVITKTKQPSEAAKIFASRKQYRQANTVHGIPSQDASRTSVYSIFKSSFQPHYDSRFFDSSLIEMKSENSSGSNIDFSGSADDIWVKRSATGEIKKVSCCCKVSRASSYLFNLAST